MPDQPFFSGAVYFVEVAERANEDGVTSLYARDLQRSIERFGVTYMWHRISRSETYRGTSPTEVRLGWAFVDFLEAMVLLDVDERELARQEADRG